MCVVVSVLIIGIVKCDLEDFLVCIMVYIEDVDVLVQVGVDIIVIDGIDCLCLVFVEMLLVCIYYYGLLVMIDCLMLEDGLVC